MVYVDEIIDWGDHAKNKGLRWTKWCHMTADTKEELHAMAKKIGLKLEWFQNPDAEGWHYDLVPSKRALAIKFGAKSISVREMGELMIARHRENG